MRLLDVAIEYEQLWTVWDIVLVGPLVVLALLWSCIAVPVAEGHNNSLRETSWGAIIGWLFLSLAALIVLFSAPARIMRHLPTHSTVGWVFLGCAAAITAIIWWGIYRGAAWVEIGIPAAAIAIGCALGWIVDALERAASSIPTSVPGLIGLVALVIFIVFVVSKDSR